MSFVQSQSKINFTGKITYTSKEARNILQSAKEGINLLKQHCGNNNFEHHVTANKFSVGVSTCYKRNTKRADNIDAYYLETIVVNNNTNKDKQFIKLVKDHLIRYKSWRKEIDAVPEITTHNNLSLIHI